MLLQVFVYASSDAIKVLITHWVSQSRDEEFSWGGHTFGMAVHAIALTSHRCSAVRFSIRPGIAMYILKELSLWWSQLSRHQWTWRFKQLFKTSFFKLLYCLFLFFLFLLFFMLCGDFHLFAPLKYESLTGWTEYEEKNLEDVLTSQYCSEDDCQMLILSWGDVWKFFNPQMRA